MDWLFGGLSDAEITVRTLCSFGSCIAIAQIVGTVVGEERKKKWFKKRVQKYALLNRRGFMGENTNFGRPITKEGYLISIGLVISWVLVTILCFKV
ncbi:MAG: hypothetical protein IIV92_05740 [Schwartzia sp.]|nr:hypothetical protein [Schwartzia sp. (in: firmicutes)]